jgi:hypothetical protein
MSFQAYLDAVEKKTGLTPRRIVDQGHARGFGATTQAGPILAWLAEEHGLGRGHGMALVHVIKQGERISTTHVGSGGSHADPSDTLWLDGAASNPHG